MQKRKCKLFILYAVLLLATTQCVAINLDKFNYVDDDKSICVDPYFFDAGSINSLRNSGWQIYVRQKEYLDKEKGWRIFDFSRDKNCESYNRNIRYLLGDTEVEQFSIMPCIKIIGGGSHMPTKKTYFIKDSKTGKNVFEWSSSSGCYHIDSDAEFKKELFLQMSK